MKKDTTLVIVVLLLVIVVVFILLGLLISYDSYLTNKHECQKLNDYGYEVRFAPNFVLSSCEVKTTRGIWINSYDFNIASVEEFVRK